MSFTTSIRYNEAFKKVIIYGFFGLSGIFYRYGEFDALKLVRFNLIGVES